MSAQIPETMLLSDLLKATGYDCPEELQGRTFAEATAGGDVQTNKASTIDVSAYTEPVVITPDTDYESMKKNTVTLSNIPAVKTEEDLSVTENGEYTPDDGKVYKKVTVAVPLGVTKLYAWKSTATNNYIVYTKTAEPTTSDVLFMGYSTGAVKAYTGTITEVAEDFASITVSTTLATCNRDSADDITF